MPAQLILTATERLSKHLQQTQTSEVLSLAHWLERCWKQCPQPPVQLLTEIQTQCLWNNALTKDAWELMQQWELDLDSLNEDRHRTRSPETQFFYDTAIAYRKKCQENAWIDSSQLPQALLSSVEKYPFTWPKKILLAGFDSISPALSTFFTAISAYCSVKTMAPIQAGNHRKSSIPAVKIGLINQEEEIKTAARWIKAQHSRHPGGQFACIVPHLAQARSQVLDIFTEVLAPESLLPGSRQDLPFNISMGQTLPEFPIIDIVFLALALDPELNPRQQVTRLLCSPFIGPRAAPIEQAQLDAGLRRHFETHIFMDKLPEFIQKATQLTTQLPSKRRPSAWAQQFTEQLQLLGWPGPRSLTAEENQTVERFKHLLTEFSSLDLLFSKLNRKQALDHFIKMAGSILYQANTGAASLHILGCLEAVGLPFDGAWILGMNSEFWPLPAHPNPYLPIALQKKFNMPSASAKQTLDFTTRLMKRLQATTTETLFSYAKQENDLVLTPSPLLHTLPEISLEQLRLPLDIPYIKQLQQAGELETITDSHGPQVSQAESIRGGTHIFKKQAACPFKAFAENRLQAHELPQEQAGLHTMERGQILHAALEKLWAKLKSHQALCRLDSKALDRLIFSSIDPALHAFQQKKPYTFQAHFILIERERLFNLLKKWLLVEKERSPFTVLAQESRQKIQINSLKLNIQIDRIDELDDGSTLIIDYKTGQAQISDWLDARPNEPQLPLYCISHPRPISGILFAQLRPNKMQFIGLTNNKDHYFSNKTKTSGSKNTEQPNWEGLQTQWTTIFNKLAQDFSAGQAFVDPKYRYKTCEQCRLQTLCRISEKSAGLPH